MLAFAAANGLMAVAAGAFGAHGVADPLVRTLLQTGAQYQAVHAAAALACLGLPPNMARAARTAGWLFSIGGLVFAGSLYALAVTGVREIGVVTPFGGLAFMSGWAVLIWSGLRARF